MGLLKGIASLAIAGLALTAGATITDAQTTATITRNVNLRPSPSSAQTPIRLLASGEPVTLISTTPVNSYYHVRTAKGEEGWVFRTFIKVGGAAPTPTQTPTTTPTPPPPAPSACGPGQEAVPRASCPAVGTHGQNVAYAPTSDGGLRNLAKRHVPDPSCTPKAFTLDDARSLQNFIDNTFGDARTTKTKFEPTRSLRNIATFDGQMGEGDLVRLSVYLVIARDEHAESVNCGGTDGTDIHLSVGPKSAHPTEYDGIVAEMIPQVPRPTGWDSTTLNRLAGKQILIVGGLTYDNEHFVNDNPASPKAGQPKRFSLWEIHPITAFYVCPAGDGCNAAQLGQWVTLTDWAKAHP
jgi:hypothetical protein